MAAEKKQEVFNELFSLAPLPSTKRGYSFHVYASPKGQYKGWVAYGHGKYVILRNLEDARQTKIFAEHNDKVNVARWSPNGEWIASGDESGKVIVWSTLNWNVKNTVAACSNVLDIDWSPDGQRIVAVGDGKQVCAKVFTWDSGNNLGTIDAHQQPILTVQYRQERPFFIVTGSEDLSLQWYKGPPFKFDHSYKDFDRYPNRAQWNKSCEKLVAVASDGKITVFDGKTGVVERQIADAKNGHKGAIYHFSWSPQGDRFLTASSDKTAKLWDLESGSVIATYDFADRPGIPDMQQSTFWTQEGKLATVSLSGAINFLNPELPADVAPEAAVRPVNVWQGHKASISGLAVNPTAGEFYTSDIEGQLVRWNLGSGEGTWFSGNGHDGKGIRAIALTADQKFVVTAGADDKVRFASVAEHAWTAGSPVVDVKGLPTFLATANKDSGLVAVALAQDKIVVIANGEIIATANLDFSPAQVAFSPDDEFLAVASKDGVTRRFKVGGASGLTLSAKFSEDKHAKPSVGVTWSPDGKLVVSTAKDASVHLRDEAGKLLNITEWSFHSATVNGARFSPNGKRLATFSEDESVIIWKDFENFKHARDTLAAAHKGGVQFVEFLDDNSFITAGGDNVVRGWSYTQNE